MATPERDAEELLRRLRDEMADPRAAVLPATEGCLTDEEVGSLTSDAPLAGHLADKLAEHLPACARCRALLAMVLDDTPAPAWAMQATRAATRAWRASESREHTSVLQLLLAWLPGAPEPQPALVGVFAAPPEPAIVTVAEERAELTLVLGTREQPVAGAEVTLRVRASGEIAARAVTDDAGRAYFPGVPAGRYEVAVADYRGPLNISPLD